MIHSALYKGQSRVVTVGRKGAKVTTVEVTSHDAKTYRRGSRAGTILLLSSASRERLPEDDAERITRPAREVAEGSGPEERVVKLVGPP